MKIIKTQFIMGQSFYNMIYYGTIFDVFKRIRVISNIQKIYLHEIWRDIYIRKKWYGLSTKLWNGSRIHIIF